MFMNSKLLHVMYYIHIDIQYKLHIPPSRNPKQNHIQMNPQQIPIEPLANNELYGSLFTATIFSENK